ncbi:hypothetical protein FQN60_007343 [Etheostoma spectabile]|uniref:Uncharacterized protein n=1 Tax=Etheostoma spectabile TaxID=54343 RepID=A0A5J5C879_9PERO|nr:hypothetical protein FQN60_007343 [Etheostoma spectabile]
MCNPGVKLLLRPGAALPAATFPNSTFPFLCGFPEGSRPGEPSLRQLRQTAEEQSPRGPETLPGGQRVASPHQGRDLGRRALPGDHDANPRRGGDLQSLRSQAPHEEKPLQIISTLSLHSKEQE